MKQAVMEVISSSQPWEQPRLPRPKTLLQKSGRGALPQGLGLCGGEEKGLCVMPINVPGWRRGGKEQSNTLRKRLTCKKNKQTNKQIKALLHNLEMQNGCKVIKNI